LKFTALCLLYQAWGQNRRQKVFNGGALRLCEGPLHLCGGLDIVKLTKTPLICSVSSFNLGAWSFVWGAKRRTAWGANTTCRQWKGGDGI